jgi:hypothetical protein
LSCRQSTLRKQHLHSTQQKSLHTPKTECGRTRTTRTAGTEPRHEQPHLEVDSICEHHGVCNNIHGTLISVSCVRWWCVVAVAVVVWCACAVCTVYVSRGHRLTSRVTHEPNRAVFILASCGARPTSKELKPRGGVLGRTTTAPTAQVQAQIHNQGYSCLLLSPLSPAVKVQD